VAGTTAKSLYPTNKFLRRKKRHIRALWRACDDKLGMPSAFLSWNLLENTAEALLFTLWEGLPQHSAMSNACGRPQRMPLSHTPLD